MGLGLAWVPWAETQTLCPPPRPPQPPLQQPSPGPASPTLAALPSRLGPHSLVQLQVQGEVGVEGRDDETHLGQVDGLGVGTEQREGQSTWGSPKVGTGESGKPQNRE